MSPMIDPSQFRTVLGHYPTGVCMITSVDETGDAVGMLVGSFTSVSLDPPLVAFLPALSSSTWAKIRRSGRYAVNVLAADQQKFCLDFARRELRTLGAYEYEWSARGLPMLKGIAAWIECDLYAVQTAGDHEIALGAVLDLKTEPDKLPLLFLKGAYGGFLPAAENTKQEGRR